MEINEFEYQMIQSNDHSFVKIKQLFCDTPLSHDDMPLEKEEEKATNFEDLFEIEGFQNLNQIKLTPKLLEQLLYDLLFAIESSEHYLLKIHHIMLEPEYIFYDSSEDRFIFCYFPIKTCRQLQSKEPLVRFYQNYINTQPINQLSTFKLYLLKKTVELKGFGKGESYFERIDAINLSEPDTIKSFICILGDNTNDLHLNSQIKKKKTPKIRTKRKIFDKKYGIMSIVNKITI